MIAAWLAGTLQLPPDFWERLVVSYWRCQYRVEREYFGDFVDLGGEA